jgi:hypothetical protein
MIIIINNSSQGQEAYQGIRVRELLMVISRARCQIFKGRTMPIMQLTSSDRKSKYLKPNVDDAK